MYYVHCRSTEILNVLFVGKHKDAHRKAELPVYDDVMA